MVKAEKKWLTISLVNLSIVALLGTLLRSKILFPLPGINFGNLLHAHSHFAFSGWVTLCLLALIVYGILPPALSGRRVYTWLLAGMLLSANGMLLSFPFQGYGPVSITFSTLLIFVSYAFSWVLIKDISRSVISRPVKILLYTALAALVVSSVGPFTLAYVMASHHGNAVLYRNAIYTYLHLQYNGFFTLGVLALFAHQLSAHYHKDVARNLYRFAVALSFSVWPTLCLSYLWNTPGVLVRTIAIAGSISLMVTLVWFIALIRSSTVMLDAVDPFAKKVGALAMMAFVFKTILQAATALPAVGNMAFGNRPVIIGYLHLVLLGFITLYLLASLVHKGYFQTSEHLAKVGICILTGAIVANEVILMLQGLSPVLPLYSAGYPWLLWGAAIGLLTGTVTIVVAATRQGSEVFPLKDADRHYQREHRPAAHTNNRVYTAGH